MLNPKQRFVIQHITREEIANNLNSMLPTAMIAVDDERLTDEVCQCYADGLSEIDDFGGEEFVVEQEETLQQQILKEVFGLDIQ